jgi:hypothetical protein
MKTLNRKLKFLKICIRKNNINFIQLEVDGTLLSKPYEATKTFDKHFETFYNKSHQSNFISFRFFFLTVNTRNYYLICTSTLDV